MEAIEAATLGALFFLALFAPPFFGGFDTSAIAGSTPWAIALGVIGAAGVGALLQLSGRALWELVTPYGPQSGWRYLRERRSDFRKQIAQSGPKPAAKLPDGRNQTPYAGLDYETTYGWTAERVTRDHRLLGTLGYKGHQYVIVPEFIFYRDAPDSLVQWCRRRYQRFVTALSTAAALGIGVGIGLIWVPAPDLGRQVFLDAILLIIASVTVVFAAENRTHAQEMEAFWFADKARAICAGEVTPPAEETGARGEDATEI